RYQLSTSSPERSEVGHRVAALSRNPPPIVLTIRVSEISTWRPPEKIEVARLSGGRSQGAPYRYLGSSWNNLPYICPVGIPTFGPEGVGRSDWCIAMIDLLILSYSEEIKSGAVLHQGHRHQVHRERSD